MNEKNIVAAALTSVAMAEDAIRAARREVVDKVSGCLHEGTLTHEECNAEAERIVAAYDTARRAAPAAAPGAAPHEARALVNAQANDEGLWAEAGTAMEAYVQAALRELHAAVERDTGGETGPLAPGAAAPAYKTPDMSEIAAALEAAVPEMQRVIEAYRKAGEVSQADLRYEVRAGAPGRAAPEPSEDMMCAECARNRLDPSERYVAHSDLVNTLQLLYRSGPNTGFGDDLRWLPEQRVAVVAMLNLLAQLHPADVTVLRAADRGPTAIPFPR